jgi:AcrR family transcriptional regulator
VKLSSDLIARTALRLLDEHGLDGLTMRLVAKELGVQVAALYWHVKNKQELLDAMATIVYVEAVSGLEAPRRGETWQDWVAELTRRMRAVMLRHRDGARMLAGTAISHPMMYRTVELVLRTLQDAGFPLRTAARSFPVLYHYAVGFTIEEQARLGHAYGGENPYESEALTQHALTGQSPLTSQVVADLFDEDTDAGFEHGLRMILIGMADGLSP